MSLYAEIVYSVRSGKLREPFSAADVKNAYPRWDEKTYGTFLPKHRVGNPMGTSELFARVSRGRYRLLRPIKYGLPQV
jgi:hypothetical protein